MFAIRAFRLPMVDASGLPAAWAELRVGATRLRFHLDLSHWRVADYERQWKAGIQRLASGGACSALMSRYGGPDETTHSFWALWRADGVVYVQPQCVLSTEIEKPFDPTAPYEHVGEHVPVTDEQLPLDEWTVALEEVIAAAFHIRWPFAQ
jgi:contact-dependent growth inhibition (CDI) system CdiI-like immunity protein